MSVRRRTYSEEFKREAVRLIEEGANRSRVARDLGVHVSLLRKWQRKLQEGTQRPFPGKGHPQDEELARVRKENARLKEENAILKKAVGIFSSRPQ